MASIRAKAHITAEASTAATIIITATTADREHATAATPRSAIIAVIMAAPREANTAIAEAATGSLSISRTATTITTAAPALHRHAKSSRLRHLPHVEGRSDFHCPLFQGYLACPVVKPPSPGYPAVTLAALGARSNSALGASSLTRVRRHGHWRSLGRG